MVSSATFPVSNRAPQASGSSLPPRRMNQASIPITMSRTMPSHSHMFVAQAISVSTREGSDSRRVMVVAGSASAGVAAGSSTAVSSSSADSSNSGNRASSGASVSASSSTKGSAVSSTGGSYSSPRISASSRRRLASSLSRISISDGWTGTSAASSSAMRSRIACSRPAVSSPGSAAVSPVTPASGAPVSSSGGTSVRLGRDSASGAGAGGAATTVPPLQASFWRSASLKASLRSMR